MEKAYNAGTFDEKIRDVNKPKLLILDELGVHSVHTAAGTAAF